MQAKLSELWAEVEGALAEKTASGAKMAILEAYKTLEIILNSKKYPGKTVKEKLFWAGYSLKDKEGLSELLKKREEILKDFNFKLTDFEVEEIVRKTKKAISEISKKEFTVKDKLLAFYEIYFSPKSVIFWRNAGIVIGAFVLIKVLAGTKFGQELTTKVVDFSDFIISWAFLLILIAVLATVLFAVNYFENKSKVQIKEEKEI